MEKKQKKKRNIKRTARRATTTVTARKAAERYKKENEDFMLAVEAMRSAQLAQESRVRHLLLEPFTYHQLFYPTNSYDSHL